MMATFFAIFLPKLLLPIARRISHLEPFVHALGVKLVAAGQHSQGLPDLKVAHADHAGGLIVLRAVVPGVPERVEGEKRWFINAQRGPRFFFEKLRLLTCGRLTF